MARFRLLFAFFAGLALAQEVPQNPPVQEPPEEDENLAPRVKEYTFNPLQAEHELKTGEFYFKKGSFKAAEKRYEEATKWNPKMAEAWFHLGEARDKLRDGKGAREAYARFVQLSPGDKRAEKLKKKLKL